MTHLEVEGKCVRGVSVQPNSVCKQQQINSLWGCSVSGLRLIGTSFWLFLFLQQPVCLSSRLALWRSYHCLNPLTVIDLREAVNVKQMYLLTFSSFARVVSVRYWSFDSLRLWKIHCWRLLTYRNVWRTDTVHKISKDLTHITPPSSKAVITLTRDGCHLWADKI